MHDAQGITVMRLLLSSFLQMSVFQCGMTLLLESLCEVSQKINTELEASTRGRETGTFY